MQYVEVTVKTTSAGIDQTAAALSALGFDDLVLDDQVEYQKFLDANRACWDYIDETLAKHLEGLSQIKLYLQMDFQLQENLDTIQNGLLALKDRCPDSDLGPLTVSVVPLAEEDWSNSWKKNYPPQFVGKNLCILPYWLPRETAEGKIPVILDPGLTFGTGAHASTQMVLSAMEDHMEKGSKVVDLGSGSGILSIAALQLGAKSALGVDIDPKAEGIARENAAYNGLGAPEFTAFTGDVVGNAKALSQIGSGYDLALVNIVADVILHLSPVLPKVVRENGLLICSGILDVRLPEILEALQNQGFSVLETRSQEDWRCVVARREVR